MKIGILTSSISRNAGGLLWAVRSLCADLQKKTGNIKIFSIEDAFSTTDSRSWHGLDLNVYPHIGPDFFRYAPELKKALHSAKLDLLHSHGLWMYPSVASLEWSRISNHPLIISPHGMLDPWAIKNSAWKKRLAGLLYENRHLKNASCLHALCLSEYNAIRRYGLSNPVAIIPNGVDLPCKTSGQMKPDWISHLPPNCKILLFLGRIHPKKGLINVLHAWKELKELDYVSPENPWHLVIAGWNQNGHREQLEKLGHDLDIGENIHFTGPQFGKEKTATLSQADAFILPSYSEGLPMAVLEAWSHNLPVIMTPQCNLPEGFSANAALKIDTDPSSISETLLQLFSMNKEELQNFGKNGYQLVKNKFTWPLVADQMYQVYEWVLGNGSRPEYVRLD
jgi:poly(glycerol-phosphate) alpha-glucosyltransferase